MNVRNKVQDRLDTLETLLRTNEHLKSAEGTLAILITIDSIAKFWRILNDNEKDLVNTARVAVEEGTEWK